MSRYISKSLRKLVAERAEFRCEYCRIYERHSFLSFHIEHIISLKHNGHSKEDNLAYSCSICNFNKGSDVATFIDSDADPVRFFNPRTDEWNEHFNIESAGEIYPLSPIGKATIKIFDLNHPESIIERKAMILKDIF